MTLLGGAAGAWPLAARAEQAAMPVIGVLGGPSAAEWMSRVNVFRQSLHELGYIEGRNLRYEYRLTQPSRQNPRQPHQRPRARRVRHVGSRRGNNRDESGSRISASRAAVLEHGAHGQRRRDARGVRADGADLGCVWRKSKKRQLG
jgi:hypothetical protein